MTKWKREMFPHLDTPVLSEMSKLLHSDSDLDKAIFELWRGRSIVSSVTGARLTRKQADAILIAIGEIPLEACDVCL